jgi:hypothetical protein
MNTQIIILVASLIISYTLLYTVVYIYLDKKIKKSEQIIIDIFLQKIAKIPAVIEVMRPYVIDVNSSFDLMIRLHSEYNT